jgi:DNA primase
MANVFDLAKSVSIIQVYEKYSGNSVSRAGKSPKALCVFHNDSNPSLSFRLDKNTCKCFACNKNASSIDIVMATQNIDNPLDAARLICDDFGLAYSISTPDPAYQQYVDVYTRVSKFFNRYLHSTSCPNPNYFTDRGFPIELQNDYLLGYCPEYFIDKEGRVLSFKELLLKVFSNMDPELLDTYKLYDDHGTSIMAGRYVFTIKDAKGNPIAFSGRSLDSDKPKYINTASTPYFQKGSVLYNYNVAKKYSTTIVVEGYCDALALISKGVFNVVAAMGTSFTSHHIEMLKGKNIILALDNDSAGYTQMYTTITSNRNHPFQVWLWDGAKDFNELLLSNPNHLETLINNKQLVFAPEFVIKYLKSNLDLSLLENREKLWIELAKLIGANSRHYQNRYPINTIYTPIALDYYWTIIKKLIKGKRGN